MLLSKNRLFNHRRYRRYFVFGLFAGSFVVLFKYCIYIVNKRRKHEIQLMTDKLLSRSKRCQYIENTEKSCDATIIKLAETIKLSKLKKFDTSSIIQNLKAGNCDKVSSWNQLKIFSFCKTVTIIYSNTILTAALRIQLSLTSAYMFKNSKEVGESRNYQNFQQRYMTLCSYFVEEGVDHLISFIEEKVGDIVKNISLKDNLSIKDLEQVYWTIMSSILTDKSRDPVANLPKYVFPDVIQHEINDNFKKLINTTLDLLECQEVQLLMQSKIRNGFVLLIDQMSNFFSKFSRENGNCVLTENAEEKSINSVQANFVNGSLYKIDNVAIPLAKIIPILSRQIDDTERINIHNIWIQSLVLDEKLKTLGVNIFEAFSF